MKENYLYLLAAGMKKLELGGQGPQLKIIEYPIANTEYPMSKLRFNSDGFGETALPSAILKLPRIIRIKG